MCRLIEPVIRSKRNTEEQHKEREQQGAEHILTEELSLSAVLRETLWLFSLFSPSIITATMGCSSACLADRPSSALLRLSGFSFSHTTMRLQQVETQRLAYESRLTFVFWKGWMERSRSHPCRTGHVSHLLRNCSHKSPFMSM